MLDSTCKHMIVVVNINFVRIILEIKPNWMFFQKMSLGTGVAVLMTDYLFVAKGIML